MQRFDRYMLSQLMVVFGFFALVLVMVYWVNTSVGLFDELIADGHTAGIFLEFTMLALPGVIGIVLPMAAFGAAVYVTNRMSNDSELTVAIATGLSPWRLARPVLVFGIIIGLMMAVESALERDRAALDDLVPGLLPILGAADPVLRGDTADLLGRIGHRAAKDPLRALLDDAPDLPAVLARLASRM